MNSIKNKLTLSVSAIILGVVIILTIVTMSSIALLNQKSFEVFIQPLADQCANTVSTYINNKVSEAETTVQSDTIINAQTDVDIISYFYNAEVAMTSQDYAYFKSNQNLVVSNSKRAGDYSSLEIFSEALNKKASAVSAPITDENGNVYFVIASPLIDSKSEVLGVLLMSYDYEEINNIVNNIEIGDEGRAYLIDSTGAYITNQDIEVIKQQSNPIELSKADKKLKSTATLHETVIEQKSGISNFEKDGVDYISGFSAVSEMNAFLIISAPKDSFFNTNLLILFCAGLGLIIIAGSFFFVQNLAKKISKPIVNTAERLRSLSEGNLTDPVSVVNSKDELNLLSTSLEDTVKSLKNYVNIITNSLVKISNGDLTDRVHGSFKGDFIKIKSTFNAIIESLIDTFANINTAAEQVNSGAGQVSDGSQALSQGATEQAGAIEQLSSNIADISELIKTNAKSAKSATGLVSESVKSIDSCNHDMNEMLSAMDEINLSSSEISKIIRVIDDIAFQTNILALNAAVEAARAGTAGKGFAVVADEVRNLAAKSAEAAKQTNSLIGKSIQSVKNGSVIAKTTANALMEVVEQIEQVDSIVKSISQSSEVQASSIIEINSGVDQISGVVQTNTATAEESAAASEELSSQSQLLKSMIMKFRLGDKVKLFGSSSFGSSLGVSSGSAYNFGATKSEFSFNDEPATEFKFGGNMDDEPISEFKFGGNMDDEPKSEFKFGGNFDDEPKSEFKFGGNMDDEPKSEFKFGGNFDDEPKSEFKFGGGFEDDNDKY